MVRVCKLIAPVLLAVALAACAEPAGPVATPSPNDPATPVEVAALRDARAALERGDHAAIVEMLGAPVDAARVELLARARMGLAREAIAAAPGEARALRAALDQVGLALALRPDEPALRDELLAMEGALVALLAVEDLRLAVLAHEPIARGDPSALDMARVLAGRASAAAATEPRLPGAEQIAATGLLAAASVFEQAGDTAADDGAAARWQEGLRFCERAMALQTSDAARSCLERLARKLNPPVAAAPAMPTPVALPPRRPTAAPRPPARSTGAFGVVQRKSFDGSGNSGQFASCIDIQVLGPGGPIAGAVLGINNGDHSYQNQTDASGYAGRCGLGASTWSVVLFWTPQTGNVAGATTTVYVNGAPDQRAAVVFRAR